MLKKICQTEERRCSLMRKKGMIMVGYSDVVQQQTKVNKQYFAVIDFPTADPAGRKEKAHEEERARLRRSRWWCLMSEKLMNVVSCAVIMYQVNKYNLITVFCDDGSSPSQQGQERTKQEKKKKAKGWDRAGRAVWRRSWWMWLVTLMYHIRKPNLITIFCDHKSSSSQQEGQERKDKQRKMQGWDRREEKKEE